MYGPPGSETYEKSVQDAVDLSWSSFPDEEPIIVEEWLHSEAHAQRTAVWIVPRGYEGTPPTARLSHRVEV